MRTTNNNDFSREEQIKRQIKREKKEQHDQQHDQQQECLNELNRRTFMYYLGDGVYCENCGHLNDKIVDDGINPIYHPDCRGECETFWLGIEMDENLEEESGIIIDGVKIQYLLNFEKAKK